MGVVDFLKRVWYFIWEEDSLASWLVNVVLAFVIIKFLLYPGLGFVLGTPAPIVAVVSGSMEHDGNFNAFWTEPICCNSFCTSKAAQGVWYEQNGISQADFKNFKFVNGFNKGDIMILYSAKDATVGDVIVYVTNTRPDPIIHRVINVTDGVFQTKGDHNCDVGEFEKAIQEEKVIGKAVWRIPYLGWVKIVAVMFVESLVR